MTKTIPPLDLLWFIMESPASPTHVGGLLLFDKPKNRPGTMREIVDAYRTFKPTPPFSYVPVLGRGVPRFTEVKEYDPCYHNSHVSLPDGATYEDLLRLVADLHEPVLDRERPLFRNWLIDGVPGNRFAIYAKVHHAIVDGISGTKRMYAALSSSAQRSIPTPAFAAEVPVRKPRQSKALAERLAAMATAATKQSQAARDVSLGALKKRLSTLFGAPPAGSMPFTGGRAPTNVPLCMSRSFATLSLSLDEMQAVGRHHGATLNDLAVTIVDEGLHRYLRQTGRPFPRRLVAMCPMSLREEGDTAAGTKVSAMFVHLGGHEATTSERIGQVIETMKVAKEELRSMSKEAALMYATSALGLAELASATRAIRVTPPLANLVISNVPGVRDQMYLNGARMAGLFPVSMMAASVGLNVTLTSCHDRMDFGFVGNGATMYHLSELARHVQEAYDELGAAARKPKSAKSSAKSRPARRRSTRK
jgi:WS/DGAT/MGAT family acyltransferase